MIKLNPAISALENAQAYFKKYQKAKKGQQAIAEQIQKTRETFEYLESLESLAHNANSLSDLELVREEYQEIGQTLELMEAGRKRILHILHKAAKNQK